MSRPERPQMINDLIEFDHEELPQAVENLTRQTQELINNTELTFNHHVTANNQA